MKNYHYLIKGYCDNSGGLPFGSIMIVYGSSLPEGWLYFDEIYSRKDWHGLVAYLDLHKPAFYETDSDSFILWDIFNGIG